MELAEKIGDSIRNWNLPARRMASTGFSATPTTLMITWYMDMLGTAASSSSLSTLASPYASYTQAFITPGRLVPPSPPWFWPGTRTQMLPCTASTGQPSEAVLLAVVDG
ncbi:hypothetical protein BDA96_05G054600 [Sorghum bicolor]|uniref:Uncharacterized protein n=1 Tax=Sorghum bicolor TaxID=4558 RepID=A0A921QWE4_SORBI|nr:hypothetical protein BDA96_05G054600 [Sorghum bicolor]